jgi:hypothetical protein
MKIHKTFKCYSRFLFIFTLIAAGLVIILGMTAGQSALEVQTTPTPRMPSMFRPAAGGLIYTNMPPNATQVDYGKEAYRLVCEACHGDRGQGLTPDWRATWAEEDQNCWKAKCHGGAHPPDGFELPRYVPAIFGREHLGSFQTALDLNNFIQKNMPWYDPGVLKPEEYLSITAYMLRASGIEPMTKMLTPELAAAIPINPAASAPTVISTVVASASRQSTSNIAVFLIGAGIFAVLLLALGWLWSIARKSR